MSFRLFTLLIGISKNLLIISEIWLIPIAKRRLLYLSQIPLTASVKINWFNGQKIFYTDSISDNQLIKQWNIFFHWLTSEKTNH